MLNKRMIVLTIIFISLFTITAVNATDNVTDNAIAVEDETNLSSMNIESHYVIEDVDDDLFSTSDEKIISETPGTFTDLANEINGAYRELELTRNYYYSPNVDKNFDEGIIINKQLVINGNGFKIDGGKQVRAFNVQYDNVVLKNIIFEKCKAPSISISGSNYEYSQGGAILWTGNKGVLDNCTFISCYSYEYTSKPNGDSRGGAICWVADNGKINRCNFINCYCTVYNQKYKIFDIWGGAIYVRGNKVLISNSYFEGCNVRSSSMQSTCDGGAIYRYGSNGVIDNCTFYKCYASASGDRSYSNGGAIAFYENYGKIINCNFDNNYAETSGGAIAVSADACTLENSNFKNNHVNDDLTKAVLWYSKDGSIINSNVDQKIIPVMVVPPLDKPSVDGSVKIILPTDATGNITFKIDNKNYIYRVNDGVGNIIIPNLNEGNYSYTIIYSGNDNYSSVIYNGNLNFKVLSTTIIAPGITTVYNAGKYLVITLRDENGDVLKDAKMNIVFNDKKINQKTDSNGQVKISLDNLVPKSYAATIIFEGSVIYTNSFKVANVIVKKATSKLAAKAKTFKKSLKIKNYVVVLKTNQNKVMKNTKIILKVNGKTYSAKTNTKGQATFKITNLIKKGKYTATIKYAGSKHYNAKTVKAKITVK